MDGIIPLQEAKKVKKMIGSISALTTDAKSDTVAAINELDGRLKLLLPSAPPLLSTKTISLNGAIDCLLSNSVPNNTTSNIPNPASTVKATRSQQPESTTITSFGSGKSGSLSVELNKVQKGVKTLTSNNDSGVYGELVITRNQAFPLSTPGFWEDLDAKYKANANIPYGYNEIQMKHSETGATNVAGFIVDVPSTPAVSNVSISEVTCVPFYSSGIKQYGSGSVFRMISTITGVISHVYGNILATISGTGMSAYNYSLTDLSVSNPVNGTSITVDRQFTLTQTAAGLATFTMTAKHPLASNGSMSTTEKIMVKIGSGGIDESRRVSTTNTDFPNENPTSPSFNSSVAVNPWEAKIVGGVLKHDKTNYSVGYMPVGEDYSSHNTNQYINLVLPLGSVGNGKANCQINVTGSFTNMWIKLPGKTGWLDTQKDYLGTPPRNDGDASRDSGGVTNPHITFAGLTTADCNYVVVLRLKLTAGQSITSITVS
jgi:hypothetical protein